MAADQASTFQPEGSFDATPGIDVVRALLTGGNTGRLLTQQDKQKKVLYFAAGRPVGAKSNQIQETLTRLAVRVRLIDQETYRDILEQINAGTEKMQGELMVERGITQSQVDALLQKQTAMRYADVCNWQSGHYKWVSELPDSFPRIGVNPVSIFIEYVKIHYKPDLFRRLIDRMEESRIHLNGDIWFRFEHDIKRHGLLKSLAERIESADGASAGSVVPDGLDQSQRLKVWVGLYALLEFGALRFEEKATEAETESRGFEVPQPATDAAEDPSLKPVFEELKDLDYFSVLGVELDADGRAIKKAYFKLAKKYHPDKFYDAETKTHSKTAEQIFALISKAYEELKDPERREMYRDFLERGTTEEEEMERAESILKSEMEFQKATLLLKRRQYEDAAEHLEEAVALHPDEDEYRIYLDWCRFLSNWPGHEEVCREAARDLTQTLKQSSRKHPEGWYLLGRMNKILGNRSEAERDFEKVLELEAGHAEAKKEIRALKTQAQQEEVQEKTGFSKIFRKS